MPRTCRFPGRLKPRPHEMMLVQLSSLTATPVRNDGDRAQLQLCVRFFTDSDFTSAERAHISAHLLELSTNREHAAPLLVPLLELFPSNPATL